MMHELPRLMIAAPRSGGGKTTVVCGLLQLFHDRGLDLVAFKCGPDYIDPLFHRSILGVKSGNLDLVFTAENTLRSLMAQTAQHSNLAIVEGVMGYYDGKSVSSLDGSSYQVAQVTGTPVVLVLDARGAALSLAAEIQGFAQFRPDSNIQGVILNHCKEALYAGLSQSLEELSGVPVVGYVPQNEAFAFESRHLGLITAEEVTHLKDRLQMLAQTMEKTLDVAWLLETARGAAALAANFAPTEAPGKLNPAPTNKPLRLAVARDRAFCFYYQENFQMMRQRGIELVEFSPLEDKQLPDCVQGLYLGGGYPELYAQQLSCNASMRKSIDAAVKGGLPTVAECGGFMYLQENLADQDGVWWPMVGCLEGSSKNEGCLKHFGYVELTARTNSFYGAPGTTFIAHEFHYWHSSCEGTHFDVRKPQRSSCWLGMVTTPTLVAGFPHMYYPAHPRALDGFVQAMTAYKEGNHEV